jgi:hypothetical protein
MTTSTPITPRSRPLSQRTQQMQQTQAMGIIGMLLILGPPAVIAGGVLLGIGRTSNSKWFAPFLALSSLGALGVLYWRHQAMLAEILNLWAMINPLLPRSDGTIRWEQLQPVGRKLLPVIGSLWLQQMACAPLVASFLDSARGQDCRRAGARA